MTLTDIVAEAPRPLLRRLVRETLDNVEFVLALPDDANELAGLFDKFFAEAHYRDRGIVYSHDKAEAWLERAITSGSCPHIIGRHQQDGIVGVVSYGLDSSFCEKPIAILHTVFVLPAWRRTAVGRILVALATEAAIGDGAVAFHAPIASGMNETATLINLFKRAGFTAIGTIMGRAL